MEIKNVVSIETPSRLFPPPLEETSQQIIPPSNGTDAHSYIVTDDDFLRDLRDYSSVLEPLPSTSADHIAIGELSGKQSVAELLERVSETAGRTN